MKILFILKRREEYTSADMSNNLSTGLFNSATFNAEMLVSEIGIETKLVVVTDNNDIDREVTKFRPTHVIIEALWVVPEKFNILSKLHPDVKWIIRLHSESPFLANEGVAMDWIGDYMTFPNVYIGVNAPRMLREVKNFVKSAMAWPDWFTNTRIIYLPNYFPKVSCSARKIDKKNDAINIACFGAVRPLKNHLTQALAAIEFAESINKILFFHINGNRVEMKGGPVMHNLVGLFQHVSHRGHRLVTHDWAPREDFIKLCSTMDIGMQVSFTESFNIVAADLTSVGVPIVTSTEIPWAEYIFTAHPTDSLSIVKALRKAYNHPVINNFCNRNLLNRYGNKVVNCWGKFVKNELRIADAKRYFDFFEKLNNWC